MYLQDTDKSVIMIKSIIMIMPVYQCHLSPENILAFNNIT